MTVESRRKFLLLSGVALTAAAIPGSAIGGDRGRSEASRPTFELNETGQLIYAGLSAGRSKTDIVGQLVERYDVDRDTAAEDVDAYATMLRRAGLVK